LAFSRQCGEQVIALLKVEFSNHSSVSQLISPE
jgi:hypothetical protein